MTVSGVQLFLVSFFGGRKQRERLASVEQVVHLKCCEQCVALSTITTFDNVLSAVEATVEFSRQSDDVSNSQQRTLVLVGEDCFLWLVNNGVGLLDEFLKMVPDAFVLVAKQYGKFKCRHVPISSVCIG